MSRLRTALSALPEHTIPTRRGWFDRWVTGLRAAYLRDRIADVESNITHQRAQIAMNERDVQAMRVQLAVLEN